MSQIEKRGLPTVAWTAKQFVEDAHWSANAFGCPEIPIIEVPECFTNNTPEHITKMVDAQVAAVVKGLTKDPEKLDIKFEHITRDVAPTLSYEGGDLMECFDRMQEAFVKAGWSDGMPLIPPTREKVDAMVRASGLPGDHVVGIFEPGFGIGTIEKLAANAVMAGCKPNAMPVIVAIAEACLDPKSRLRTFSMSTGPQAPLVLVSGPYAKEIGMNAGICALGPGSISQVNVAIGRTLRLMMMNIGHSYPAVSDMDTIGSSMKFSACVAENEERNPFEPFRVFQGFPKESTTVTVVVPYGVSEVWDFRNYDPEQMIGVYCSAIRNGAQVNAGLWLTASPEGRADGGADAAQNRNPILMCPDHAAVFARAGWSIKRIQEALYKGSFMPFGEVMLNKEPANFKMSHPDKQWMWDKPETKIPIFRGPEEFEIFVVGGDAGRSLYFYGGGDSMTREVKVPR